MIMRFWGFLKIYDQIKDHYNESYKYNGQIRGKSGLHFIGSSNRENFS